MPTSGRWWRLSSLLVIWLRLSPDAGKLRRSIVQHDRISKDDSPLKPQTAFGTFLPFFLGEEWVRSLCAIQ
jgi:hypothetical protein